MDNLTLRPAGPDDSEFAYSTKKAAFREYVEQVGGWDEAEQRRLHVERFAAQDFRIVSVDGTDVGVVALSLGPDCLRLNQLFILPEHQGRGIGRACMTLSMNEARQRGLPLRLQVLKINTRAQAFYERLGFTRTGENHDHYLMAWSPSP